MVVRSRILGEIEVDPEAVLFLPEGLLGFEELKRYILVEVDEFAPFLWMVSVEEPEIGFAVSAPELFYGGRYDLSLSDSDKDVLDFQAGDPVSVFVIVSIGDGGRRITANLKGPVVLNTRNRLGKQVVVYNPSYAVRQGLLSLVEGAFPAAGAPARGRAVAQG